MDFEHVSNELITNIQGDFKKGDPKQSLIIQNFINEFQKIRSCHDSEIKEFYPNCFQFQHF